MLFATMKMQQLCRIAMLAAMVLILETQAACDEKDTDAKFGKRQLVPPEVIDDLISSVNDAIKRNLTEYWKDTESRARFWRVGAIFPVGPTGIPAYG